VFCLGTFKAKNEGKVVIFDTTLRDGEQTPGVSLTAEEKVQIARQLARLGVDVIEAGFPAASPGDLEAVRRIALEVEGPTICALARAKEADIRAAWEAIQYAERPRIHVFIATSAIHLEHKLRMSREEVLARVREMVAYARSLCDDVEFSPEDASRTEPSFLYQVLAAAIAAGATTVNIPDTVGYALPQEFAALIAGIREHVPGIDRAVISVHCHDDLGLAVANSLAAVSAGARQVECTVNGLGERAGNAALEEVVMALEVRCDLLGLTSGVNTAQIARTSRMVSTMTGVPVPPNKAIVGGNAFAHESGIHQDGVLKERRTYEIIDPKTIGLAESKLVLGKLSGRHALKERLLALGYRLSEEELARVFTRFKELADVKEVTEADLEAIVADELYRPPEIYHLEQVQVVCGDRGIPTATVRLRAPDGRVLVDADHGTGPVDAVYRAINRIVGEEPKLIEFSIKAITGGLDAIGEVTITVESPDLKGKNGRPRIFSGQGAATDIVVASAKAYMNALNKLLGARKEEE
jgi:2-isopropylmalate synthase